MRRIGVARLDQSGIDHQSTGVERPKGENPAVEGRGDGIDIFGSLAGRTDEDGVRGTVRIIPVMADVVEQKDSLADSRVVERYPAWKARPFIDEHARHALRFKLAIIQLEKRGKGGRVEAFDCVGHVHLLPGARFECFPPLALKATPC